MRITLQYGAFREHSRCVLTRLVTRFLVRGQGWFGSFLRETSRWLLRKTVYFNSLGCFDNYQRLCIVGGTNFDDIECGRYADEYSYAVERQRDENQAGRCQFCLRASSVFVRPQPSVHRTVYSYFEVGQFQINFSGNYDNAA